MSYICAECLTPQPAKTPQKTIVIATRPRTYDGGYDEDGKLKVSRGEEIEREAKVCPGCYAVLRALQWARQEPPEAHVHPTSHRQT